MADKLREHIFSTYLTLRYGIVAIGALLPVVIYIVGIANNVPLQNSMSAYYWASPHDESVSAESDPSRPPKREAPSRDWFVGGLFAIAAFLYLYKGFSTAENIALNLAALLAVGVAVFPMEWECGSTCGKYSIHGFCAVAMFVCLVYVVWFRATDTLSLITDESRRARYRRFYKIIGVFMLASPVTAFVMNSVIGTRTTYVFFIEAVGIWAFALYWSTKSTELKRSAATAKALAGQVSGGTTRSGGPVTQVSAPGVTPIATDSLRG